MGTFARLAALSAACAGCVGDGLEEHRPAALDPLTIQTDLGQVHGVIHDSTHAFLGIPYAEPPVGELRWRAPRPASPWTETLEANRFGSACIQVSTGVGTQGEVTGGSEDCLTLNVWTPAARGPEPLPVLFFIHGGFFLWGSSGDEVDGVTFYDARHLAAVGNAVVVTINYRLGVFGFLAHPALVASDPDSLAGNYGILDQIAALQWVQRNVAAFGGDPDRVLIFGESAGADSVCDLLVSPRAAGLFSSALMQSGGCLPWGRRAALRAGRRVSSNLGCDSARREAECLRARSTEEVATAFPPALENLGYTFAPNVDPGVIDEPFAAFASGAYNEVPTVIGSNADEATTLLDDYVPGPIRRPGQYWTELRRQYGAARADRIYAHYPPEDYDRPRDALVAALTDDWETCPARTVARALADAGNRSVYRYFYTHVFDAYPNARAGHAMELIALFGQYGFEPDEDDEAFSATMMGYWSRLAATGDPNGASAAAWPTYRPRLDPYLQLDDLAAAGEGVRTDLCDFWDRLY